MNEYKCCSCKKIFTGSPAITNACGKFCQECENTRKEKLRNSAELKFDGRCMYCGAEVQRTDTDKSSVCAGCHKNKKWLLKCIRYSDQIIKYVKKTEAREGPEREERIKRLKEWAPLEKKSQKSADAERIDRLEDMMEKLIKSLGGV